MKSGDPFFEHGFPVFFGGGDAAPPTQASGNTTAVLSSPSLPGSARTRPWGHQQAGTPLPGCSSATAHASAFLPSGNRVLRSWKTSQKSRAECPPLSLRASRQAAANADHRQPDRPVAARLRATAGKIENGQTKCPARPTPRRPSARGPREKYRPAPPESNPADSRHPLPLPARDSRRRH